MTRRSATAFDRPSDIALGAVAIDVATAAAEGATNPPEWIKIAPRGTVTTRDGRNYRFEPETLAARFAADGVKVPVDIDHAVALSAATGAGGTAVGWADELQARDDGLYARIDWLAPGIETLSARTRRYVSPAFKHTSDGTATWIHSIALVAAPALSLPAIASAGAPVTTKEASMKSIALALGLAETADEAACLAAITTLSAGKVDKAVHDQALANLAAANTQLAAATAKLAERDQADHKAKVDAALEGALKDRKILPAQREQYAALCATSEGLAQVTALLAATPAGLQPSGLDDKKPASGGALSESDLATCAALGISEADFLKARDQGNK
jgi:phage I-like protein